MAIYDNLSGNDLDWVRQIPNIAGEMKDSKRTFAVKTIPVVVWVTRTVVWALGINTRGIRMALL